MILVRAFRRPLISPLSSFTQWTKTTATCVVPNAAITHDYQRRFPKDILGIHSKGPSYSTSQSRPVWKLGPLNHVAIAVPDLAKSADFYKNILRAESVSEPVAQPEHGVYTVFVNLGNTKIELLGVFGDKSPIANFLEKNKHGGIHHVCIEVDNVKNAVEELTSRGVRALDPEPKIGAHGKPVVFLHPKDCGGVLVELEQA